MKEFFKPETDERPGMIILGIFMFYFLIAGFILYLFFLHRINLSWAVGALVVFTLAYLPRFIIIRRLLDKDEIQILDDCILINGNGIYFDEIVDFRVKQSQPAVVFFMNNKMVVYNYAKFRLRLTNGEVGFNAFGTEKIELLREFFNKLLGR